MNFITGYSRLHDHTIFTAAERTKIEASTPEDFLEKVYARLNCNYPKFYKMDAQSKLGFLGAEILFRDLPIAFTTDRVAVVLSNADASLDTDMHYQESMQKMPSPSLFVYTLANIVIGEICIRHKFQGENAFFVSPSFDPEWMAMYVDQVMEQDGATACVAGWVDVLRGQHDVFLYLVEKQKRGIAADHTAEKLATLYHK